MKNSKLSIIVIGISLLAIMALPLLGGCGGGTKTVGISQVVTHPALDATRQGVIDAMYNVIEELAKEVSLCFKYYSVTFRGQRPQEAFFTGAEAYETALLNALKRHLGVEITIAQPLRGFDLSQAGLNMDKRDSMCEWALPVGLSIKGWNMAKDIKEA